MKIYFNENSHLMIIAENCHENKLLKNLYNSIKPNYKNKLADETARMEAEQKLSNSIKENKKPECT